MLLAQEVLHAYTMISISMMVVFTSLSGEGGGRQTLRSQVLQGQISSFKWCVCMCVCVPV